MHFALDKGLTCVEACRTQALSTAISTLTAFYANNEDKQSDTLNKISDTLLQVQITLSSLSERVDNIERNVNNEK